MDPNDVVVDGEKIFKNLKDFQKTRVKTVLNSVGKKTVDIIRTAFELSKEFCDLQNMSTLNIVLNLIEIISQINKGNSMSKQCNKHQS